MDNRISKTFTVIFSSLYPDFNEEETKNSEKYFNFILENFPDRSEIVLLKVVFFIFSFEARKIFIKDSSIPKFVTNDDVSKKKIKSKSTISVKDDCENKVNGGKRLSPLLKSRAIILAF